MEQHHSETRQALDALATAIEELSQLDADQRAELAGLFDDLGHQTAADQLRGSRRDLLKTAGVLTGTAIGGGILGATGVDRSRAASNESGTWGDPNNPQDVFVDDLLDSGNNIALTAPGNGEIDINRMTVNNDLAIQSVAASGEVDLSSGSATVDTGLSASDSTYYLALGGELADNAKIVGRLDLTSSTVQIELLEDGTGVGNPTVNYDVIRVR